MDVRKSCAPFRRFARQFRPLPLLEVSIALPHSDTIDVVVLTVADITTGTSNNRHIWAAVSKAAARSLEALAALSRKIWPSVLQQLFIESGDLGQLVRAF